MLAQAPHRGNGRRSEGPGGGLPPALRAELRRLLAAILVADVRAYPTVPQEVGPSESLHDSTLDAENNQNNPTVG